MAALTLEVVEGPSAGRQVPLTGPVEIGRDPSMQVALDDELVSRRHARLAPSGDGAIVEDLGSTNGTFVNGQEIFSATPLAAGDQLLLGTTLVQLRSAAQVASQPSAVRAIPPGLRTAPRRPDYISEAVRTAVPELDPLLDIYVKRKARTAPLAIFALAVIVVILFVAFVVRK